MASTLTSMCRIIACTGTDNFNWKRMTTWLSATHSISINPLNKEENERINQTQTGQWATNSPDAKALDSAVVKKSNNLSDINASNARNNLGIYSQSEVNSLIAGAETARSVETILERDALADLKVTDRVFVTNDGDGKWALYLVTAITDGTQHIHICQSCG